MPAVAVLSAGRRVGVDHPEEEAAYRKLPNRNTVPVDRKVYSRALMHGLPRWRREVVETKTAMEWPQTEAMRY